ncbi:MAG: heterodisulfide reductase subunit B, partial [Proteobacteria bacterium]|nr:heterodisulfide reductase subunit B [Pseudomonadota bacterium]
MNEVTYFPGCSLHGTAREYDESFRGVSKLLDIALHELDDWTCCGSTSAHST